MTTVTYRPGSAPMLAEEEHVEYVREHMPEPSHIKTERFVKEYSILRIMPGF